MEHSLCRFSNHSSIDVESICAHGPSVFVRIGRGHDSFRRFSPTRRRRRQRPLGNIDGGGFWRRLLARYGDCANDRAIRQLGPEIAGAHGPEAEALRKVDELMRRKAESLGLARRQMHITAMLEAWLFIHIPATFALLAALVAHIVSVFLYW